jgi:hypothetical protein
VAFVTRTAGIRRGLVALLLFVLILPAHAQSVTTDLARTIPSSKELSLKSTEEVLGSRCHRIHENPLNLLFLLPGVLILVFAVSVRRRRSMLTLVLVTLLGSAIFGNGTPWASDGPAEGAPQAVVRNAERAFDTGEAEEALQLYLQAESRLSCNPALEHNLGVCYATIGRTGDAVVHLRRSLRYRPADGATRRALQFVEKSAGLEGQLPMPVPVNPEVLFVVTLVLANLSLGAAGFAIRRKGVRALIVMILLTISGCIGLGFFLGLLYNESRPVGVVVVDNVGLVKIPEDDARSSFVLPPGTSLRIRGEAGGYYLVETASQFQGWVRSEAILLD